MAPGSKRPLNTDGAAAARRRRLMAAQAAPAAPAVGSSPDAAEATLPGPADAGYGATSGARRAFTDADAEAIVAAFMVAQTRNGRTLSDADVESVAGVMCRKLEEGALSAARFKENLVEPVADAAATSVEESLSAFEARQPNPEDLAKMVADPVVAEVKRAIPPPPKPLEYTEMTKGQLRAAINEAVPPSALRKAEHGVIKQRVLAMSVNPVAKGDVLTQLTPPIANGNGNNKYVWAHAYRITLGVMQVILNAAHASGNAPEVFRDWTQITADDQSPRHACFVAVARGGRHDVRADGRKALYVQIIYFLMHKERDGVHIKLLHPDAVKPDSASAKGDDYYAIETSIAVCEGGVFKAGQDQRVAFKVVRSCLIQKARSIFYEFIKDKDFSAPVLVAVAETLRVMILDDEFDWHQKAIRDHVGTRTSGPRAWRLLLPREETCSKIDKDLETATNAQMDLLDEIDVPPVEAAADAAEDAFGFGDDDFGIMLV